MLVTVQTDASYSEIWHLGAWACWIRADDLIVKKAGKIRDPIEDGNACELIAIANALAVLQRHKKLSGCRLVIRTDSQASIKLIKGGTNKGTFSAVLRYIAGLLAQVESYRFEHIRAHTWDRRDPEYSKPKYYANRWCDMAARRHLREACRKAEHEKATKIVKKAKKNKVGRQYRDRGYVKNSFRSRGEPYKRSRAKKAGPVY